MKKNNLLAALCIMCGGMFLFAPFSYAYNIKAHEDEYMFVDNLDVVRGFIWGLTPDIIQQLEKATFVGREMMEDDSNVIFYIDKIWDVRHTIGYEFDAARRLWRVKLFNEKKYHNPQDYMEDLLTIQNHFTERYGKPIEENFYWKNNEQLNKVADWGWALYRGNLAVDIIWQTSDSIVRISLKTPEPLSPEFIIVFEDRKKVDEHNAVKIEEQKPQPLIPVIEFDE